MLKFVESRLYYVKDENNFINQMLQVGSGWPKINGSESGSSSLATIVKSILTKFLKYDDINGQILKICKNICAELFC